MCMNCIVDGWRSVYKGKHYNSCFSLNCPVAMDCMYPFHSSKCKPSYFTLNFEIANLNISLVCKWMYSSIQTENNFSLYWFSHITKTKIAHWIYQREHRFYTLFWTCYKLHCRLHYILVPSIYRHIQQVTYWSLCTCIHKYYCKVYEIQS